MKHHKNLVTLLTLFIIIGTPFFSLGAQTVTHENQIIGNIEIVNETPAPLDTVAILAKMKTKQGDLFSHADFDNDLKALAQEYDRVIPQVESRNNQIFITLKIWPKPVIHAICWEGNHKIKSKTLESELGISAGSVFDRQAFNKAFHKLKTYYIGKGYFEAELDYQVTRNDLCNEVDVTITVQEGRAGKIKDICIEGVTSSEKSDLMDKLITKEYNFFTSWVTHEGNYNQEAVQQDQFTILNYLQNEGYADATVDIEIVEAKECNRIILSIKVVKGPLYTFGPITFSGNTLFCDQEIQDQFLICEGDPYAPDLIRDSIREITNLYGKRGYIDTAISFEPRLNCEGHIYSIHFTIEEGKSFRVGMIKVFGNCSTQTSVILHETLLVPGEVFNIEKLQKTEERLTNIGYFKNVNVYAVKSEGTEGLGENYRDVHIEVEETTTGSFSTTFGFSSNEALFGGISLTERNFNYRGLRCLWREGFRYLRGGGEYAYINATFGTKSRKYELSWAKPFFMDTDWTVGFDLENSSTRYISNDYTIDASGLTLHATYQYNSFLSTGWHYRLRYSHIDTKAFNHKKWDKRARIAKEKDEKRIAKILKARELKSGKVLTEKQKQKFRKKIEHEDTTLHKNAEQVKKEREDSLEAWEKLRDQAKISGLVSAVGTSLYYNSSNHPTCPTEGFQSRLSGEVAGAGGRFQFFGLSYVNSFYYAIHRRGVLKFRADWRFVIPYGRTKPDRMPLDERLFLGGDTTVRGYRPYRLGPQFNDGDPKGGLSLQYYSIEYHRKINRWSNAFLFFDAGQLSEDVFHFGRLNTSIGYGVELKLIPSMPAITLGMGYPLNARHRSQVRKFFFQMGGRF